MTIRKYLFLIVCSLYSVSVANDLFSLRKELALSFLRITPDAVSRSIGGSNQAYSIGAVDLFINPALLSQHTQRKMQFSNIIDLFSNQYASLSFSMPLGSMNHIGIGLAGRLKPNLPDDKGKNLSIRNNDQYQFAVVGGYSRNFSPFSLGANIKYFRIRYYNGEFYDTGSAIGFDLGVHYFLSKGIKMGFIYQIPFDIKWDNGNRDPISGRTGIGIDLTPFYVSNDLFRVLLSMERFDNEPFQFNFGVILTPVINKMGFKNLSIRAGIGNFQGDFQNKTSIPDYLTDSAPVLNIGAGLGFDAGESWKINLDYCYQVIEYLSNQHIFTTRIGF